jgi:transposase
MNHHLKFISQGVDKNTHVVLVLDQAGWHIAKDLQVPSNITLLHLPPYSPELNPIERLWAYLKSHYLSNRAYANYKETFDTAATAWNKITQDQFRSLCNANWITRHEN